MTQHAPTTNDTQCLSPTELHSFIERVGLSYEFDTVMGLKAIIVHATSGDVAWVWFEAIGAFCWKIPGLPV